MLYIGIDPGESWCGFAALQVTSKGARADARTLDIQARGGYVSVVEDLIMMIQRAPHCVVALEDYRIRPQGHQRFSRGLTLRMIGAIEYAVAQCRSFKTVLISPGNADKEARMIYGTFLDVYRAEWPERGDARWGHCLSAWRVLGRYLLGERAEVLRTLRRPHVIATMEKRSRWLSELRTEGDLLAPCVSLSFAEQAKPLILR